ncbi:MAG: MarR family transcriptional regulator [Firmicutes bacterium]|nr:MarR family transcriptional regulator [Bacillota bacterium]
MSGEITTILRLLREINRAFFRDLRADADRVHVTPLQLLILRRLNEQPEMGLNELARSVQLADSTVSSVVDRLVAAQLVERQREAKDRRSIAIRLADGGKEKLRAAFGEGSVSMAAFHRAMALPEQDRCRLELLLQNFLHAIDIAEEEQTEK